MGVAGGTVWSDIEKWLQRKTWQKYDSLWDILRFWTNSNLFQKSTS